MAVQARFWVQTVTKRVVNTSALQREVVLAPVIRPSGAEGADGNVDWAKYTPSGEIRLTVSADAAGEWFEDHLGKDIAITFDEV